MFKRVKITLIFIKAFLRCKINWTKMALTFASTCSTTQQEKLKATSNGHAICFP